MSSINWTDSLNYASEFFVGLYDSAGNMWSNGPLHSSGAGTIACLAGNATFRYDDQIDTISVPDSVCFFSSSGLVQPAVAAGAGVGGLVIGSLIGVAIAFLFIRRHYQTKMQADLASLHGSPGVTGYASLPRDFQYRSIPTSGISHPSRASEPSMGGLNRLRPDSLQYHIEPFVMPDENGRLADESTGNTVTTPTRPVTSPTTAPQQQGHVYVLHHDSNVPPVTIFHENGTEIVELPPRYLRNTSQSDMLSEGQTRTDTRSDGSRSGSSQPLAIHESRQPGHVGKSARLP
jgi:hypothetical protein